MNFSKKQLRFGVSIIALILISYFSFFNDYFKYLEVKRKGNSNACNEYYNQFPDGYFTEDVKVIEIEDSKDIVLIRDFINDYPNSEYSSLVELINLEIWNTEIKRYDSVVTSSINFDKQAVDFFRKLLYYMRDENKSTIYFHLSGKTKVKDFEDYSTSITNLIDDLYFSVEKRYVSRNIENITSNYSSGDIDSYENILITSINNIFENILSDNFISIKSVENNKQKLSNELLININYNIKNQEEFYDGKLYPTIWEYFSTKESGERMFLSYFIGVVIDFNFNFNIPKTNIKYNFKLNANPLTEIKNITSLGDAYRGLTKQNFQDFSEKVSNNFGIKKYN